MTKTSYCYDASGMQIRSQLFYDDHLSTLLLHMADWLARQGLDQSVTHINVDTCHENGRFYWGGVVYYDENSAVSERR